MRGVGFEPSKLTVQKFRFVELSNIALREDKFSVLNQFSHENSHELKMCQSCNTALQSATICAML